MSTRYNTGNPIESTDVRDMSDNAKNLDLFSSSSELSFDDRFGVERKTIHGMNSEFDGMIVGMNSEFDAQILNIGFTRVGTFLSGATLTNPRQTLLWDIADGGDGQEYGWSGTFPKIVPPGRTPSSTGGIAVCAWISRFDPELRIMVRESIRRSYAEAGYNLVDGSFEAGGTLVDANDVLLQELTGKAFSGPAGTVAVGTNPASGGFVDKSGWLLRHELATSDGAAKVGNANGGSVQDFIDAQYTTVAELATGKFKVGQYVRLTDRAGAKFNVVQGGVANGYDIINAGNGNTAVYVLENGVANVKHLGGKTGIDSSGAVLAALSLSNQVHFPDDDVYEVSFDNTIANAAFFTYENQDFVYITGSAATIKDANIYTESRLTDIIKFTNCGVVAVSVNFSANKIADIGAPMPLGLGYLGSSALYLEEGCTNVLVNSKMDNVRYGVRSGDFLNTALSPCSNMQLNLDCYRVGYPTALYLADNIELNITSNIQHRAVYLSGCKNVRGTVDYKGFTYATVAVLITSQLTVASGVDANRRARGCSDIQLKITDSGSSTTTTSFRAMSGIGYQWKAPDTEFTDIHLHLNCKTSNADNGLSGFRLENTVGWMPTNHHENITISGRIDRSEQTAWTGIWSTISIDGIAPGDTSPFLNSPTFSQIKFVNLAIPSQGPTNHANKLNMPRLKDKLVFDNVQAPNEDWLITTVDNNSSVLLIGSDILDITTDSIVYDMVGIESSVGALAAGVSYRTQSAVLAPSGRDTNINNVTYQWYQFNYTAAPNPQTSTFPVGFDVAAYSVQLTPTFVSGVTCETYSTTKTSVVIGASKNCTINVLAIGV